MKKFYCENMKIRDELGREVIFKGANHCYKGNSISQFKKFMMKPSTLDTYKELGINLVRLGITWNFLEPFEGEYNDELIDLLKEFCDNCKNRGIYVYLDLHQDLYSPYFYGDGAPNWAVNPKYNGQKFAFVWAEGYFYMNDVQNAFADFWNDENLVQTKFIKMWQHLTCKLSSCDNIIAYDYLNEPYVHENGRKIFLSLLEKAMKKIFNAQLNLGEYFSLYEEKRAFKRIILKIITILKTPFGVKKLLNALDDKETFAHIVDGLDEYTNEFNEKYYEKFYNRIKSEVNEKGLFNMFEHNYYSNLGIPFEINTTDNDIYSPHAYDFFVDTPLYNKYASNNRISVIIDAIRQNQLKMNVPVIFGEWGGSGKKGDTRHLDFVVSQFEKYHWSNTYWGDIENSPNIKKFMMRPAPIAVCGDIDEIRTDVEKREFHLKWTQNKEFPQNIKTEVFVPNEGIRYIDSKMGKNEITIKY